MHIIAKQLQRRRKRLEGARRVMARSTAAIKKLQETCVHTWKHSKNAPKPTGTTGLRPKWWVHRMCTICDKCDSALEDRPACSTCLQPLRDAEDDPRAAAAVAETRAVFKYATLVFVFACDTCATLIAIPTNIDPKDMVKK
jgi:hypothetical protein